MTASYWPVTVRTGGPTVHTCAHRSWHLCAVPVRIGVHRYRTGISHRSSTIYRTGPSPRNDGIEAIRTDPGTVRARHFIEWRSAQYRVHRYPERTGATAQRR